jgi:hypothetical protein
MLLPPACRSGDFARLGPSYLCGNGVDFGLDLSLPADKMNKRHNLQVKQKRRSRRRWRDLEEKKEIRRRADGQAGGLSHLGP